MEGTIVSEQHTAMAVSEQRSARMADIDQLIQRFLAVESAMNANIPTTLWISDLHGEGDRFKSILRGRFGMLYQTCREALPNTFSAEKIQYLVRIIRRKEYIADERIQMDMQDVIFCLCGVLKYKLTGFGQVDEILRPEFRDIVSRLLAGLPVPDPIFEEEIIARRLIAHLADAIRKVLLDRIQVLGDVFDRGPQPDKIIRILSSPAYRGMVDYVWGNHDILWMGAASGNRSLVAEALRITCRYDHFTMMERLRFDTRKLAAFAAATYPDDQITGKFKAKTPLGRAMEKALTIIQFKLEERTILENPEYEMQDRLWLNRLSEMLKTGEVAGLNDTSFPTINLDDPMLLSEEEQEIIDDLTKQFLTNHHLKRLLAFFFTKGRAYHVHNNTLNIHALVPSTAGGEFDEFMGRQGKKLLDFIQDSIRRVGVNYLAGREQRQRDQDLFFYLWCGPKSPFFGKQAMKTFERYFLTDKATHEERSLYWRENIATTAFKQKMLKEFGVRRVVYGHTPVNYKKGLKMASDDGVAINIDGGFAEAYYNRGHALVHTPRQLYGIILPTPDEIKEAMRRLESAPLDIELIEEFRQPMKVRDTQAGQALKKERDALRQKIRAMRRDVAHGVKSGN
jgi:fructose-1,6-bisphosphatase-3